MWQRLLPLLLVVSAVVTLADARVLPHSLQAALAAHWTILVDPDGWALVRASNTQPALSLRFEATTEERLEELKGQFLGQVEHWVTRLSQAVEAEQISS